MNKKRPGPKPKDGATGLRRHIIMLDKARVKKARRVGDGALSLGVRRAIDKAE